MAISPEGFYLLIAAFIVFFIVISKTLQHFLRAFIAGIFFLAIPFIATEMGYPVSTDVPSLMAYLTAGIGAYFAFSSVYRTLKIMNTVLKPFNRFFRTLPVKAIKKAIKKAR